MNDEFQEKLSALMDGELNEFETRQLLRQLDQMPEEMRTQAYEGWQRMHNTSALMQSQVGTQSDKVQQANQSFVATVADAIAAETPDEFEGDLDNLAIGEGASSAADIQGHALHSVEGSTQTGALNSPALSATSPGGSRVADAPLWSRFALAASVALAVVVGVQQYQIGQQEQLLANSQERQQLDQKQINLLAELQAAQSAEEQLVAQQRLMDYLQERKRSPLNANSADPFAKVANFAEEAK